MLLDLRSGARRTWEDVESFEFSRGSGHLLVQHRRSDPEVKHRGADAILRDLGRRSDKRIRDVGEARFNKTGELLAYPGESHGLAARANRRDFTTRLMQFFDHHLRGAPAPRWMTEGVPFLDKKLRREPE